VAYDAVTTLPGFVFPNYDMTTGSGATFKDTIMGYNIDVGSPSSPTLCRLLGTVYNPYGGIVATALVKVCPEQAGVARSGNLLIVPQCKLAATDATGAFFMDVIRSDSLHYPSSDSTFYYNITVSIPSKNQPGVWDEMIIKERVSIPNASSYQVDLYLVD
jgi:hypothetical protein